MRATVNAQCIKSAEKHACVEMFEIFEVQRRESDGDGPSSVRETQSA